MNTKKLPGTTPFTAVQWIGIAFLIKSLIFAGTLEDQRRIQNHLEKRALQVYGDPSKGIRETVRRAQSDTAYRQSVYFSPQGVRANRPGEIHRAIEKDLTNRETRFNETQQQINRQMDIFSGRLNQTAAGVLDFEKGEYRTQNKDYFSQAAGQMNHLSSQIKDYRLQVGQTLAPQLQKWLAIPYFDRQREKDGDKNAAEFVHKVLYGEDGLSGLTGMESAAGHWSKNFYAVSEMIKRKEDDLRGNYIEASLLGSVQMAAGVMLIASGAGFAAGTVTMISGATQLGENARNHVVLNQKGLEALRPQSEQRAASTVNYFQKSLAAAQIVNGLQNLTASIKNAGGFSGLQTSHKFYAATQYAYGASNAADLSGLNSQVLGENGRSALNRSLAGLDLGFKVSGISSSFENKLNGPSLEKQLIQADLSSANDLNRWAKVSQNLLDFNRFTQTALSAARINPETAAFFEKNRLALGLLQSGIQWADWRIRKVLISEIGKEGRIAKMKDEVAQRVSLPGHLDDLLAVNRIERTIKQKHMDTGLNLSWPANSLEKGLSLIALASAQNGPAGKKSADNAPSPAPEKLISQNLNAQIHLKVNSRKEAQSVLKNYAGFDKEEKSVLLKNGARRPLDLLTLSRGEKVNDGFIGSVQGFRQSNGQWISEKVSSGLLNIKGLDPVFIMGRDLVLPAGFNDEHLPALNRFIEQMKQYENIRADR